jgi:hypothetical protein
MSVRGQKIFTKVLSSETITFTADMGISSVSIILVSGVGTFSGDLNVSYFTSEPIDLVINQAVDISSDSGLPLDNFTIDSTGGGVVNIIARQ